MSGSSLDGLDVCLSSFTEKSSKWSFEILRASTIDLPDRLIDQLSASDKVSEESLIALDKEYGVWIGQQVKSFVRDSDGRIDCVAVHGHTVFHEPTRGISMQIGDGDEIAKVCGLTVIDNFRIDDIKKGGQGAPLVPVGEYYLFPEASGFVNLGGISNVSILHEGQIKAWDIGPCNQVLNYFSSVLGHNYDKGGALAWSGTLDQQWYDQLTALDYLAQSPPKSLSNQWSKINITSMPSPEPLVALHTYTVLLADLIVRDIKASGAQDISVMFTGGGTHNSYLIDLIEERAKGFFKVLIPSRKIIEFKEALIFGLLGVLKLENKVNVFASVTGASKDTIAGHVHLA